MVSPSVHPNKSQFPRNHWIGSRENRTSKPETMGLSMIFPWKMWVSTVNFPCGISQGWWSTQPLVSCDWTTTILLHQGTPIIQVPEKVSRWFDDWAVKYIELLWTTSLELLVLLECDRKIWYTVWYSPSMAHRSSPVHLLVSVDLHIFVDATSVSCSKIKLCPAVQQASGMTSTSDVFLAWASRCVSWPWPAAGAPAGIVGESGWRSGFLWWSMEVFGQEQNNRDL